MVQPDDDFHVFADCVRLITADLDDFFLQEYAEGAGYDEQRVAPGDAPVKEGAEVLDDLEPFDHFLRDLEFAPFAVFHDGAVRDTDETAGHDGGAVLQENIPQLEKGIALDTRIRVQTGEQGIG